MPSFEKDGHIVICEESSYGGNNGGISSLKGENKGDLLLDFARSFRKANHYIRKETELEKCVIKK